MPIADTVMHVRTNRKIKDRATKVAADLGINLSAAVNLYLNALAQNKSIPLFVSTEDALLVRTELRRDEQNVKWKTHASLVKKYITQKQK